MSTKKLYQNEVLNIRISSEVKQKLQQIAESYSMSSSEYLRFLLLEDIRKHELNKD